ncbi:MAG: hypothetical protein DME85_03585 [Verrucomicrobia bacterium]|nr:MAG: hypothetical protein DME85_03585 [Verrucomicrobiota bacterium]
MNQATLLQIAERLEALAGKLPEKIRRPVLSELTPLKELFLRQRRPRFLFVGSSRMPMHRIVNMLFAPNAAEHVNLTLMPVHRWIDWNIPGHGTVSILDARDAAGSAVLQVEEDLKRDPADIIFFFDDGQSDLKDLLVPNFLSHMKYEFGMRLDAPKIIGLSVGPEKRVAQLKQAFDAQPAVPNRLVSVVRLTENGSAEQQRLMSILAEELPNEAKIEMIRISHDRKAQAHVAKMLIKSVTAICTAIGAQPIPLADLPILTTLQVVMVSGIMYVSGRERSLRGATEFIAALGANVGVAMLLREAARAILKFFPGWGNVVCGMVAGAGTYAIGRAATAYFLEGASLKDARRTYLRSRKKRAPPGLEMPE